MLRFILKGNGTVRWVDQSMVMSMAGVKRRKSRTGRGQGRGVGTTDGHGQGFVAGVVQGLHRVNEELPGQSMPAVRGVGEELGNECGFSSVASEGPFCREDRGGDAAFRITRQQGRDRV